MRYLVHQFFSWSEARLALPILARDRILSAISTDGLNWEREPGIRIDVKGNHGSDMIYWPHAVRFPDGWRLYFFGSQRRCDGWTGCILSAWSEDGMKFSVERGVRVAPGGQYDRRFAAAPCVAEGQGHYRMYYVGSDGMHDGVILSAVSQDGLTWAKEPGVRLAPIAGDEVSSVTAPHVVTHGGMLRMYYTQVCGRGSWLCSAVSTDGLNWIPDTVTTFGPGSPRPELTSPSIVRLQDGWRLYVAGHDGAPAGMCIYSAHSKDSVQWCWEPGVRLDASGPHEGLEVGFPHVVRLPDRGWCMFYVGYPGACMLRPLVRLQYNKAARSARRGLVKHFISGQQAQDYRHLVVRGQLAHWGARRVLDLGCGEGLFSAYLIRVGARPVSLDINRHNVTVTRRNMDGGEVLQADAAHLPFANSAFDALISTEVLTHIAPNRRSFALAEIARTVRPGGEVVLTVHNRRRVGWRWLLRRQSVPERIDTPGAPIYPEDGRTLADRLHAAGFELLQPLDYLGYYNSWLSDARYLGHPRLSQLKMWLEDLLRRLPLVRRLAITTLVWAVRR